MNHRLCLVLNKHWKPISFCSTYHGISKMLNDRAVMLDSSTYQTINGEEWMKMLSNDDTRGILTPRGYLPAPEIIIAQFYEKIIYRYPSCNRKNIIKRDGLKCQYTGDYLEKEDATIDHLIPRSRGGPTSWDNCVVTSFDFNNKKGARTPEEINKRLIKNPTRPIWGLVDYVPDSFTIPGSWKYFIGTKKR